MIYTVKWDTAARTDLKKLDYKTAEKIIIKVDEYLVQDPQGLGKPLSHKYAGLLRYRFGNYRVIYEITKCNEIIIIKVGHRKDIY